jgi:hypothetical protein
MIKELGWVWLYRSKACWSIEGISRQVRNDSIFCILIIIEDFEGENKISIFTHNLNNVLQ